jgi:hypothetical protein
MVFVRRDRAVHRHRHALLHHLLLQTLDLVLIFLKIKKNNLKVEISISSLLKTSALVPIFLGSVNIVITLICIVSLCLFKMLQFLFL